MSSTEDLRLPMGRWYGMTLAAPAFRSVILSVLSSEFIHVQQSAVFSYIPPRCLDRPTSSCPPVDPEMFPA